MNESVRAVTAVTSYGSPSSRLMRCVCGVWMTRPQTKAEKKKQQTNTQQQQPQLQLCYVRATRDKAKNLTKYVCFKSY